MSKVAPNLMSPFDLHDLKLKNRVVLAPLTRCRAGSRRLANALMAEYYSQRADAGLLITEATTISRQANGWVDTPGIYTAEQAEAWKLVVDAVHKKGTPIFVQLWHTGRSSHSDFQENGELPVAPSAIKIEGDAAHTKRGKLPYQTPRALETEEIGGIVQDYLNASKLAKQAGFDGVELHTANGYLIDEFLQSKTNKRTDLYGGSIENRFRFLREIVEAISTVWSSNRIGVRLAPNGIYNDMGSPDYIESFTYYASQLDKFDLAYLHVLDTVNFGFHNLGEPMTLKHFRPVFKGPLMGNCGYTGESAEEAISTNYADLIAFGRPFISNPDLVYRLANGLALNPEAEMKDWYSHGEQGYTDFPEYAKALS